MTETHTSLPEPPHESERTKSHRPSIFHKFRHKKSHSGDSGRRSSAARSSHPHSPVLSLPTPATPPPITGVQEPLPDIVISEEFFDLYHTIVAHVQKFYGTEPVDLGTSQAVIEHAVPA